MYEDQNSEPSIHQNNPNLSFQNITKILKDNQAKLQTNHLEQRIEKLVTLRDKLIQLIDMDKMVETQKAVEERMGPKMCDNSVEERSKMKNRFMDVLDDYKQKVNLSAKKQRQVKTSAKQKCRQHINQLQTEFQTIKNDYKKAFLLQQQKIKQLKIEYQKQITKQRLNQGLTKLEQQLYNFQNQIDLQILDFEIVRRKRMDSINSRIFQLRK